MSPSQIRMWTGEGCYEGFLMGCGCQVCDPRTPSPLHTRESVSSSFMSNNNNKKILYPGVLLVSSVCCVFAHLQNIQHCLACPSVCVLVYVRLCLHFSHPNAICSFPIHPFKSWRRQRCGHSRGAEQKTELRCSPSVLLPSCYSSYPPQSLSPVPPPAWCPPRGGAGPVRASRCPCISCAEWRPGP